MHRFHLTPEQCRGQVLHLTGREAYELYGAEVTAVELYPPLDAEWKTHTNPRQIWVMPLTWERPFGLDLKGAWGKPA